MPKTRVSCPNCRQPIVADIEQLIDAAQDPTAKAKLLSGAVNYVQCPNCGYRGGLATPIVYHDPQKELLLTFVPPELGLPHNEQERLLGQLINQVVNSLPPQQRKAYLLQPQAQFTMQSFIERILEADGITREMIQAQQQRLNLLQRLITTTDDAVRLEIIKQESELVDADMFGILTRLYEAAAMSGDPESANQLEDLRNLLLQNSEFGRQVQEQTAEVQAAVQSLQEAGSGLSREKLLELVIAAPNETRLSALTSLARPGMDYQFFQLLSERIEQAEGEQRESLISLRERLLEMTRRIDQQVEERTIQARQLLNTLLGADNIGEATAQNMSLIDEFFLQVLAMELETSRKSGDLERISKLQQVADVLQQASAPPQEISLIEELLDAPDDQARRDILEGNRDKITPDFLQILSSLVSQVNESQQDPSLAERLKTLNRQVLRFSMEANLRGG